ncbi:MAG: PAS domain S-box protein [Planctomycetes bacterium]|nr:PAS domain S-box protein [Planctomycetota bacterium]
MSSVANKNTGILKAVRYQYVPLILVVCTGVIVSILLFTTVRSRQRKQMEIDFYHASKDRVSVLKGHIDQSMRAIEWVAGFYNGSPKVEREEFREFVQHYPQSFSSVQALEWIPRVPDTERQAYEAAAREDGFTDFQFTERKSQGHMVRAAKRKEYFPVYYVEPYKGNETALGFDLASNPTRLETLKRSCDTGELTTTSRITLVQETSDQFGFIAFKPIYLNGASTNSVTSRRQNLEGFAMGVFRIGDILKHTANELESSGICVELFDMSAPRGERFLAFYSRYLYNVCEEPVSPLSEQEAEELTSLHHTATLNVGGRKWLVLCTPAPCLLMEGKSWHSWAVLGAGLVFTCLLTVYILLLFVHIANVRWASEEILKSKQELESQIIERKRAEKRLAKVNECFLGFGTAPIENINSLTALCGELLGATRALYNRLESNLLCSVGQWNTPLDYKSASKADGHICSDVIRKGGDDILVVRNLPGTTYAQTDPDITACGLKTYIGKAVKCDGSDIGSICALYQSDVEPTEDEKRILGIIASAIGVEEERSQAQKTLQKRIKEISCLYSLSKLIERQDVPLEQIFQDTPNLIRNAYRYPNFICVRVTFNGIQYKTDNFEKSELSQRAEIKVGGGENGNIEVCYLGERTESSQGPFLKEEFDLLGEVAQRLGETAERKKAGQTLRLFQDLIDRSNDSIFVIEPECGRFLDVNDRTCTSLAYTREELLDMSLKDIDESIPDDSSWQECLEELKLKTDLVIESRHRHKDATTFCVETSLKLVKHENKDYIIGAARDITERKQVEQRQAELLQQVENINQELKDFAYIVSHDLKAPLRGIKTLAEWISTDYADKLDEQGKEQLNMLSSRVQRMHNLIDGVLQYSKVGREKVEGVRVNLNKLVSEVIDMLAPPENIEITVENELPVIECEETRIIQVFENLLSNAMKYMDKPQGRISIGCVRENDFWKFSVTDNGPGIEEKHLERIFQIFQTLSPRDEYESTGVGLAVVKKIVELYGGNIWVESKPGEGSTFYFTLPNSESEVVEDAKHQANIVS